MYFSRNNIFFNKEKLEALQRLLSLTFKKKLRVKDYTNTREKIHTGNTQNEKMRC